jgi:hypothetical protein
MRRRTRRRGLRLSLAAIKNKLWIVAGILAVSLAIVVTVGPKVVELDGYIDRQIERLRAKR